MSDEPRATNDQRHLLMTLGLAAVLVLALGVGFVAGFLTGRGQSGGGERAAAPAIDHSGHAHTLVPAAGAGPAGTPAAGAAGAAGTTETGTAHAAENVPPNGGAGTTCVYELPVKDQWVLAGMTCNCNESHCNHTPLLACHCDSAHQMKSLAKQLIVEGMGAEEIGAELEKRWGPGILPARGAVR